MKWIICKMRILGIIPARGGSKGIPNKNIVDLCGKPLIAWSIKTGLELIENNILSRCIVSTDNKKIAGISEDYGAEVPFFRPAYASTDKAKSIDYVMHALNEFEKKNEVYDAVMILQPTSPQRNIKAISNSINKFIYSNSNSLISCYKEDYINELVMYVEQSNESIKPLHSDHNKGVRRQKHGSILIRNGSLYVTKIPYLLKTKQLICDNPLVLKMDKLESVNLDNLDDLKLLRIMLCK
jgi:CMP-N,N'-diacetyllegionaminic acid synthase